MTDLELLGISILLLRTVRVVLIVLDYCQLQSSRELRPSYQLSAISQSEKALKQIIASPQRNCLTISRLLRIC